MKNRIFQVFCVVLAILVFSCKKEEEAAGPKGIAVSSSDPARGLAIYVADPGAGSSNGAICQVEPSKLTLIGKPLTESDIDSFDPTTGKFKLKVSQYDWLGRNKAVIQKARVNGGGYYAMAITLEGKTVFGGAVLSFLSSLICSNGNPFFWEETAYSAPNPGPNPRNENSYSLPITKVVMDGRIANHRVPQIDTRILARLEKIGKLKK